MIVVPAIDLKQGRCVRLRQGDMAQETVFSNNPVEMALRWESDGAELLHIVDLDGAVSKRPANHESIKNILSALKIPVQVGGGIRDSETIETYLSWGVNRVILGTVAHRNPDLVKEMCRIFPGRIVVGIDARNGKVAVEGWTETTDTDVLTLAQKYEDFGVRAIIFTDIKRDGMQTGPNIEATKDLARSVGVPIYVAGGVSTLDDIKKIAAIEDHGVEGVITGRAIYSGTLIFREAVLFTRSPAAAR